MSKTLNYLVNSDFDLESNLDSNLGCNLESKTSRSSSLYSTMYSSTEDSQQIRFEIVNRKRFRLLPEHANIPLIPLVLVGNKRRVCDYITYLNESSPEFRSKLKLKKGQLIPFKMIEATDINANNFTIQNINLLCIFSEVFDRNVETRIRERLKAILANIYGRTIDSDRSSDSPDVSEQMEEDTKFIKNVNTIYLKTGNANMKIIRVRHRKNQIEKSINMFKKRLTLYSEYPEYRWEDLIDLKYESQNETLRLQLELESMNSECTIESMNSECTICSQIFTRENIVVYDKCHHRSCLECAGAIVTVTKSCPYCRVPISIADLIVFKEYIPSFFSTIKEIILDIEASTRSVRSDRANKADRSIIYLQSDIAIQHLVNFLIGNITEIIDRLEIVGISTVPTRSSEPIYYLASSNTYTDLIDGLNRIIVCPNNRICKELMIDYKSYGTKYGSGEQELIIINSE